MFYKHAHVQNRISANAGTGSQRSKDIVNVGSDGTAKAQAYLLNMLDSNKDLQCCESMFILFEILLHIHKTVFRPVPN